MAFTYASNIITQANTNSTGITAVASGGTGLLDLTVSNSAAYSAGDLVQVTGTTNYSGAYLVDSIPDGTTIRIPDTDIRNNENTFGSTETGTVALGDKDLSGLSGLTGVTVDTPAGVGLIVYTLDGVVIHCDGAMLFNAYEEKLVFKNPGSNGACFMMDQATAYPTVHSYNTTGSQSNQNANYIAMEFNDLDPSFGNAQECGLEMANSSANAQFSGTYYAHSLRNAGDSGNVFYFDEGTVKFEDAILVTNMTDKNVQLRFNLSTTVVYMNRVRLVGTKLNLSRAPDLQQFNEVEITDVTECIINQSGSVDAYARIDNLKDDNAGSSTVRSADNGNGHDISTRIVNYQNGYASFVWATTISGGSGDQRLAMWKEHNFQPQDENGSSVTAKYYAVDSDSGNRSTNYTEVTTGYSYTVATDNTYSGEGSDIDVDDIIAFGNSDGTLDNRGKNANAGKTFTFASYNNDNSTQLTTTDGLGRTNYTPIMVTDFLVTETTKTTVDAYSTIDDAIKAYDAFKSEYIANFGAGALSKYFSRAANQLVSLNNNNLVINSAAASVFDFSGSTGTIKSTTFTGGFDDNSGTGKVTIQGATALSGGTFDSDIDYKSSATTITGVTCTGTLDLDTTTTYIFDGCDVDTVYNSSGGSITIETINGTTINTVTNGPGASTTVNAVVFLTIQASGGISLSGAEIRIYDDNGTGRSLGDELDGVESNTGSTFVTTSVSASNQVVIQIMLDGYVEFLQSYTMPSVNSTFEAALTTETNE